MQKNKVFHILSYIPLLFLVSLFIEDKNNPTVRFHCGQGMLLTIFVIASNVVCSLLGWVLGWVPVVGAILVSLISLALGIFSLVLMIIGIINAAKDKTEPLPIIGKYAFYK